jgi:hypothetical protein
MKISKAILIAPILYLCSACGFNSPSKDCLASIKTGKFKYTIDGMVVKVTRTNIEQIETYNNGNSKIITKIKWLNESEYLVKFQDEINAPGSLKNGDEMKVTILECDDKKYLCEIKQGAAKSKIQTIYFD